MYFNDALVIKLSKKIEESVPMNITSAGFDTTSPQKLFKLTSVDVGDVQLDVERLIVPSNLSTSQLSRQLQFYYLYETKKTSISPMEIWILTSVIKFLQKWNELIKRGPVIWLVSRNYT